MCTTIIIIVVIILAYMAFTEMSKIPSRSSLGTCGRKAHIDGISSKESKLKSESEEAEANNLTGNFHTTLDTSEYQSTDYGSTWDMNVDLQDCKHTEFLQDENAIMNGHFDAWSAADDVTSQYKGPDKEAAKKAHSFRAIQHVEPNYSKTLGVKGIYSTVLEGFSVTPKLQFGKSSPEFNSSDAHTMARISNNENS
jgi:hypothetical protein